MGTLTWVMNIHLSPEPQELELEGALPWGAAAFSTIQWNLSSCSLRGGSCGNKYYPVSSCPAGPPRGRTPKEARGQGGWGGNRAGKVSLGA